MAANEPLFSDEKRERNLARSARRQERLFLEKEVLARLLPSLDFVKKEFLSLFISGFLETSLAPLKERYPKARLVRDLSAGPFDLILDGLTLHHTQDVPGKLKSYKDALAPDGLMVSTFFGGDTLKELRACFLEAEITLFGGASLRVSPMISLEEASRLFQSLGFHLPVADRASIELHYETLSSLLREVRAVGQSDPFFSPPPLLTPRLLMLTEALYKTGHATEDGRLKATLELITLTGWKDSFSPQASR